MSESEISTDIGRGLSSNSSPVLRLENEAKSRFGWRLVKSALRDGVGVTNNADVLGLSLMHGLRRCRNVEFVRPVTDVQYNPVAQEYYTIDGSYIRIFRCNARKLRLVQITDYFEKLIQIPSINLFVGWSIDSFKLILMTNDFQVISASTSQNRVKAALFNKYFDQVITCGKGLITIWVFRYGGRYILPIRSIQHDCLEHNYFTLLALEPSPCRTQKLFAVYDKSVVIFQLSDGSIVSKKENIHVRNITAVLFFNPLKYLITASYDGSIKIWAENWHLQLVFVGHCAPITSLSFFPYGPMFMSASEDKTIRVWNLETCDQVDSYTTEDKVLGIDSAINRDHFFSYSHSSIDLWKVESIHKLHSIIGQIIFRLKPTDHPYFPIRVLSLCKDSAVRLISPSQGDVITTMMLPASKYGKRKLRDATYAIAEDTMFSLYDCGHITKSNTTTNPCTVIKDFSLEHTYTCLEVYEYVISETPNEGTTVTMETESPLNLEVSNENPNTEIVKSTTPIGNRTILLAGNDEGDIELLDWNTLAVLFSIKAHKEKAVKNIVCNVDLNQIISSGLDNVIKVWRVFPYAREALAPLMSFYCGHQAAFHEVLTNHRLAVAFHQPMNATYSIAVYNMQHKDRFDHSPKDDHDDTIIAMATCKLMGILATASLDSTVRIWNENSELVRILKLGGVPTSLCFSSENGDLLVSISNHLYRIDSHNYMPGDYEKNALVKKQCQPVKVERSLNYDNELMAQFNVFELKRIRAARSSFKFTHYIDVLTTEENNEMLNDQSIKEKAFAKLEERNNELNMLRYMYLESGKKIKRFKEKKKPSKKTKKEAFKSYLELFYSRADITMAEDDDFEKEILRQSRFDKEEKEGIYKYRDESDPTGFFPSQTLTSSFLRKSQIMSDKTESEEEYQEAIVRSDGYIPNSTLVKLLWPKNVLESTKEKRNYVPPKFDDIPDYDSTDNVSNVDCESNINYDYREPTMDSIDDNEEEEPKSDFMARMNQEMERVLTPVSVVESKPPTPEKKKSRLPPPRKIKPVKKLVSLAMTPTPPALKSPPTRSPRVPSAEKTAHLPVLEVNAPVSKIKYVKNDNIDEQIIDKPDENIDEMPFFIKQFCGEFWFDRNFPGCNEKVIPKPWTISHFTNILLNVLSKGSYGDRVGICNALHLLHQSKGLLDLNLVCDTVYNAIANAPPLQPVVIGEDCTDNLSKQRFLESALKLLHFVGIRDRRFFVQMIVGLIDGNQALRDTIITLLRTAGLQDPSNHLLREIDSWDTWSLEAATRIPALNSMAIDWLNKQKSIVKIHLEDNANEKTKGPSNPGVSILKRNLDVSSAGSNRKSVNFEGDINKITYMDAMNHFCELGDGNKVNSIDMHALKLQQQQQQLKNQEESAKKKNTVLVLPHIDCKQRLIRLGEVHKCKPREIDESRVPDKTVPASIGRLQKGNFANKFPGVLSLPMNFISMNPFPTEYERQLKIFKEKNPSLFMLQNSSKRFFSPWKSYVEES